MVSKRFAELETAKAWGLTPAQWDDEPEESRAEMVAFEQVMGGMQMFQEYEAERKRAAQDAKRPRKR